MIATAIKKSIADGIDSGRRLSAMPRGAVDGRASRRPPDLYTIGGRVQAMRERREWSQRELGNRAGLSQPTIANFERGRTLGGYDVTLAKIAKALGVSQEWLRTGKGNPIPTLDANSPEGEVQAIYRKLNPANRKTWLSLGRTLAADQE